MGRRVDADGGLRFEPGRGRRPWGRVARVFFRSKVESSEWSNFGGERLLGAANGKGRREEFRNRKAIPLMAVRAHYAGV